MENKAYTEDQLVEQPAIGLFAAPGWQVALPHPHPPLSHAPHPLTSGEGVWDDETGMYGRETKGEVVLVDRLRAALTQLNSSLPGAAIQTAIDEITRDRSAMSLEAANRANTVFWKTSEARPPERPQTTGEKRRRPLYVGFTTRFPPPPF